MSSGEAPQGPVVVTGGSGFIGAHLVNALVASGRPVHVLGRATSSWWRLGGVVDRLTRHDVDLSLVDDRRRLTELLSSIAPTEVFHLAGAPLVAGARPDVTSTIAVNIFGTHALVEAATNGPGCAVVTVGDAFEYEDRGRPLRVRDADTAQPTSIHGITRLAAGRGVARLQRQTGAPISTIRLFSVHGPFDHPQRLLPRLVHAGRTGDPVALSAPDVVRDWLHVDDVVALLRSAARLPADAAGGTERIFNGGSGVATTLENLVATVAGLLGSRIDARWATFPATEHDQGHWVADIASTTATLGWSPSCSLADGIARTIEATDPD